jgi:membrane-bound inhibitor of C-type lysozyme
MGMKFLAVAVALLLAGCQSIGGPGVSHYYECDRGLRLKVDYFPDRALVSANGSRAMNLKQVPTASGAGYEGGGYRLMTKGSGAIWSGLTKEAPYRCDEVVVPR